MKTMIVIFLAMTWYSIIIGEPSIGILTVSFAVYTYYAGRLFDKAEESRRVDPACATTLRGTMETLEQEQCECMARESNTTTIS